MEAKINKVALILAVLGVILSASVGAWALSVDPGFNSRGGNSQERNLALLCFGCCALIVVIYAWGFVRTVKRLSPEGVERRDGSKFKWADLKEVRDTAVRGRGLGSTQLRFRDGGSAWLSPPYASNYASLRSYVISVAKPRSARRG
jgi:hypothetical protein